MQDTVIKGNGRSRIIKGPADMPATYEEWRAQVMAGTAQLDVSVNPDTTESGGISQLGTPLDKAHLLTDEVASLLGLMDDATIDAMFKALWALKGEKNGFASLDKSGCLPTKQLPLESIKIESGTITGHTIDFPYYAYKYGNLVTIQLIFDGTDTYLPNMGYQNVYFRRNIPKLISPYGMPYSLESKVLELESNSIVDFGTIVLSHNGENSFLIGSQRGSEVLSSGKRYSAVFNYLV